MEPLRTVPAVVAGSLQVNERRGSQNRQQADAFRQALRQSAEGGRDQDPARESEPVAQATLRRTLQKTAGPGRKDEGTAHHVDVLA